MPGKRPPSETGIRSGKRERKAIPLAAKLEVLRRFEEGEKLSRIARALGLAVSTVATIRDNKEKIKASSEAASPARAAQPTRRRSAGMENVERLLGLWIQDQNRQHAPMSATVVQDEAKSSFGDLQREQGGSAQMETFGASRGWLVRFKGRHGLPSVTAAHDAASPAAGRELKYPEGLKSVVQKGGYTPRLVFNIGETGLYWKRMPENAYISVEEDAAAAGRRPTKDRLMLLLGGNAAGDFKLKPLLVYHSENPQAMKGYSKPNLPVIWRSNKKAWITRSIFHEWFTHFFCPAVEKYCAQNNLANKALLILENAPGHPVNLSDLSDNVRVEYLVENKANPMQPMGQGVISTFKAHYLRKTFQHLLGGTDGEDRSTVREFWRNYNIMNAVDNIAEAWDELEPSLMNSVWKKIWPECVHAHDVSQIENITQIQQDILALANDIGFAELVEADVDQLLQSHDEELSNEELMQLEQERAVEEKEENEDAPPILRQLTTKELSEAFSHFEAGMQILANNDPNSERKFAVSRGINDTISCYRELYNEKKQRSKQLS
ncbi:tigger transposable element-derived protein 1-like [Sarcophilus harrisii]